MERITNTAMAKRKVKSFLHLRDHFGIFIAKCAISLNSEDGLGLVFKGVGLNSSDFTILGHSYRLAFNVQFCNNVMRGRILVLRVEQDVREDTPVGELQVDDLGNFELDQDGFTSRYHVSDDTFYKDIVSVYLLNLFFQEVPGTFPTELTKEEIVITPELLDDFSPYRQSTINRYGSYKVNDNKNLPPIDFDKTIVTEAE